MKINPKNLKIGQSLTVNGERAIVDKIDKDGIIYVVTESVYGSGSGQTNYFKLVEVTEYKLIPC
jgi:hypothetical protein